MYITQIFNWRCDVLELFLGLEKAPVLGNRRGGESSHIRNQENPIRDLKNRRQYWGGGGEQR